MTPPHRWLAATTALALGLLAAATPAHADPEAPHFGPWFPELFAQLVANAHPPVR